MPVVTRWTGLEVKALRAAKRLSQVDFAGLLGVSDRMVVVWEGKGRQIVPRGINQASLDTVLASSPADAQARFVTLLAELSGAAAPPGPLPVNASDPVLLSPADHVRHPLDGKLMTAVSEGIFLRGTENKPLWEDMFYIDVFPTTNADYARFVAATGHRAPRHWNRGRCPVSLYDHPVVWVTWHDARAYARWCHKRLPTATQWEKAARGTSGSVYPWGDQATAAKLNVRESHIATTTPVSRYHSGVSPYGVYDLCGNTWEWCASTAVRGRYELKGSAWTAHFRRCAPSSYNDADATMMDDDTGFRCVTAPEHIRG